MLSFRELIRIQRLSTSHKSSIHHYSRALENIISYTAIVFQRLFNQFFRSLECGGTILLTYLNKYIYSNHTHNCFKNVTYLIKKYSTNIEINPYICHSKRIINSMKESVRILRFAIVGSSNALITALVIWILMDILDCNYLWSNMAGYVAALVNNFFWSKYWVFSSGKGNFWKGDSFIPNRFWLRLRYSIHILAF